MITLTSFGEGIYFQLLEAGLTALSDAKYPASTSFIDVTNYERFGFLIGLDVTADALTYAVQQATAANGTPKAVASATKAMADDDDGDTLVIEVKSDELDINNDYRFVTLDVSGNSGTNNSCIFFWGIPYSQPVTQPATFNHTIVAG